MTTSIFDDLYRINRLMNNYFKNDYLFRTDYGPSANIYENESEYMLVVQVPGINKENISISMKDNSLKITGEFKKFTEKDANFHLRERPEGKFERSFMFNDKIDTNKIEAENKSGLLLIKLPKANESKSLKINIK